MSNRRLVLAGGVCVLLLASACVRQSSTDTRAADEATIRALDDAQWSKTAAAHDLAGTVAYYSDDATLLPPNAPMATDKQAIRASWAELLVPENSVSWQVSRVEVSRSGDLAYLVGTYRVTTKDAQGKSVEDRGKLLEVWKRQVDGQWKAVADPYNSDLPAVAPPEKKI